MYFNLRFFIQYLIFFSLTPIFYSFTKNLYGDIYFQNIPIYLILIILFNFLFLKNLDKISIPKVNLVKVFSLILIIAFIIFLTTYVLLYNIVHLLLFYLSIFFSIFSNEKLLLIFNNKKIYFGIVNFFYKPIFIFFTYHSLSLIYHQFSEGNDTILLEFFEKYDWLPENISATLFLITVIIQYKFNISNNRINFLKFISLYLSIAYDTWIITIIVLFSYLLDFFNYIFKAKSLNKKNLYIYIFVIILILFSTLLSNNFLNFENFFSHSVSRRVNEIIRAIDIGFYTINDYHGFFDNLRIHSVIALMINYHGILGVILILFMLIFNSYWFIHSKSLIFYLLIQLFFLLELFTKTIVSPYFIIFFLISYQGMIKNK